MHISVSMTYVYARLSKLFNPQKQTIHDSLSKNPNNSVSEIKFNAIELHWVKMHATKFTHALITLVNKKLN